MKKTLLPLALMSALLVSCEKTVPKEHYRISLYPNELYFDLFGGEQSVTMSSSHDWEMADYPAWCIPSIKSGGPGEIEVIFTVTENDSESQREGKIVFSCGDATDSISVLQDGLNNNIKFRDSDSEIKSVLCSEHRTEFNGQKVIIDIDRDNDGEISYKEALEAKYMYIESINSSYHVYSNFTVLKYFPALEYVYIDYGEIDSLDFTNCPNLKYLDISCWASSLDVSGCTALEYLDCYHNHLTSLDLSNNTALDSLRCHYNQLTSLDLSNNTALSWLECYRNQLTSLDLSNNTALSWLDCHDNQLTSLDVSNNIALEYLSCNDNQLTSLDLSNNTALEYLYCSDNMLTKVILLRNNELYHYMIQDIIEEYGDIIEYVE